MDEFTLNPGIGILWTDLGLEPADVLARAGLPADFLVQGGATLPAQRYFDLWHAMEAESGDPLLPLRIGAAITVEVFDPPIFAAMCSPDLEVATRRLAQYKRLIGPMRLQVSTTRDGMKVQFLWPKEATPPHSLRLTELVFWVALARLGTRHQVKAARVTSPEAPEEMEEWKHYRDYLGVEIERGREQAIWFSREDCSRPFLTANEAMWEFFEKDLRRRLTTLDESSTMTERVQGVLLEMLPSGITAMADVARKLAVSTRTLQRRLKDEGTTFKDAVSRTRESLARHYLGNSRMTSAEIAFLLGYEDTNSFYRAFRGWTGQTPEMVRAAG